MDKAEKYYYRHINKVNEIVDCYDKKYNHIVPREDLFQAGVLGLFKAYHNEKKKHLITATIEYEVVHEILTTGYAMVMTPQVFRRMIHLIESEQSPNFMTLSYTDKIACICEKLKISEWDFHHLVHLISLYSSEHIDVSNVIAYYDITNQVFLNELKDTLLEQLETSWQFWDKHEIVLKELYGLEDGRQKSYLEVASILDKDPSKIRTLESQALRIWRSDEMQKIIKPYMDEWETTHSY